jgi:hypothetical protein
MTNLNLNIKEDNKKSSDKIFEFETYDILMATRIL